MRTSAIGIEIRPRSATRGAGFTLIEILVVTAIAGIVLAMAVVNLLPSDVEIARREAGYVALAIEKARDGAWFGGVPTAVSFDQERLREWRFADGRTWELDTANDRPLGEARVTRLVVDGETLPLNQRLVFLSDGFGVPFRVSLEIRGIPRTIEGDAAGSIAVLEN